MRATVLFGCACLVAGGCGQQHQAARRAARRPNAVVYQWPPPKGASFCRSLVDSYERLAVAETVTTAEAKAVVVSSFAAYAPTLVIEAPPSLRAAAGTYLTPVSAFLRALAAGGMDFQAVPPSTIAAIETPAVAAAQTQLSMFAHSSCDFDLGGAATESVPSS